MKHFYCMLFYFLFFIYPVQVETATFLKLQRRDSLCYGNTNVSILNGNILAVAPKYFYKEVLINREYSSSLETAPLSPNNGSKILSNFSCDAKINIKNFTKINSPTAIKMNKKLTDIPVKLGFKTTHLSRLLLSTSETTQGTRQLKPYEISFRENIILHLQKTTSSITKATSLELLLAKLVKKVMVECDLIILFTNNFGKSRVLDTLAKTQRLHQIAFLDSKGKETPKIEWKTPNCQGTVLLMSELEFWYEFGNNSLFQWDYSARVLVAGLDEQSLREFTYSKKARKTEHIAGVVKGQHDGHYRIFVNSLLSKGEGIYQVSNWRGSSFTNSINPFPDKVSNLQGTSLNVIVFEWHPAIMYHRDSKGDLLLRYGRDVLVVEALSEAFNFTIAYREPHPDELWGVRLPNGSYSGMVGFLERGEGDLAIANLFINALGSRGNFQEFSTPYDDDKSCFMARVDPPLPNWHSPALPFQMTTWIVIGIGLVLTGPVLYLLGTLSRKSGAEDPLSRSLTLSSIYTFGVHFSQPMAALPKRSSIKLFVAFLWIYSIVLTTGYKSNLTAFLTITLQPASIETFEQLYRSGLKVMGFPFFRVSLENSGNPYLRALVNNFVLKVNVDNQITDILEGKGVNLNSIRYLEGQAAQLKTPRGEPLVRIMKECFLTYSIALAYQRHSPLKSKFDKAISRIFESGLVKRWLLDSINLSQKLRKPDKDDQAYQIAEVEKSSDGVSALSLDHLQGVFFVLGFGYGVSMVLFALEVSREYGKFQKTHSKWTGSLF